ncbi:AAA ATPase midasin [Didymosphaeria variabile]|uniref:Midasin n=1 Tax=Didymosphaeria variabile TaxID=1932322 RepID=A0A9W8XQI0_9PLEO|nr:AAA ATPase midasin [Didymosphaeria variabile]KAJ4356534.1 AAA ATPase midasin [Didymosphaeria variabile]
MDGSTQAGKTVDFEWLARKSIIPARTDDLFVQYEFLFVEVCTRWMSAEVTPELELAALGRILPLAPHLAEHAERLAASPQVPFLGAQQSGIQRRDVERLPEQELCQALLGWFRLMSFDCRSFAKYMRPAAVEQLFQHTNPCVRYLAVRNFCLYVHTADHAMQEMVKRVVGKVEVEGVWEGRTIDFVFLSLWEEKRWKELQSRLQQNRSVEARQVPSALARQLSPYTVNVSGVLLPRLDGAPSKERPLEVISTPTTESNLQSIAHGLLGSSPLLLTGLAGSGKTLLTRYLSWQLNKLDSMVTLHLNEQSDAKLLVGMYATGAKPGTFSWRPGVLTTAVREGRWIFIEDLDRAPNEVVSTLLPLIERGELLIPSRGETVRAARGFRIIATMRSTLNPRGQEIVPRQNMIGHRFWKSTTVHMPGLDEFEKIVSDKYPALGKHVSGIMRVYARLLDLYSDAKFSSENGTSLRALTPRDLLKWCDRIAVLLAKSSSFSEAQRDDIFMEAFDCFAGSLRSEHTRARVMACVAEELHIDPQRRDHLLQNRDIKLEAPAKSTSSGTIKIGRTRLSRHKNTKLNTTSRPFSTNGYTLRLLEKIAVAVDRQEPLLLVGETGTGKTTCIQYLAEQLGRNLIAFNLSQQSESGDLLGGYKPVNVRSLVIPMKDEFDVLFDTTFSRKKNQRFMEMLGKRVAKGNWKGVCTLWREALKMVDAARKAHESQTSSPDPDGGQPKKKRKMDSLPATFLGSRWDKFATDLHDLEAQLANGSEAFAFSFLEGNIVKAVRNGDWVLLDEINLASSDTLEALADLLGGGPDGAPSILLTETGNVERVIAHPNFRVFAAMNPATDVGKKDLPPGIRSRFTELYVESPDSDKKSLQSIVEKYLGGDQLDTTIVRVASDVTKLYLKIQELARANMLVDGAEQKAHFSLRTLTRTLSYAREIAPLCTLRRALFEGFHMSFLTFLGKASEDLVAPLIKEYLFQQKSVMKSELGKPMLQPSDGRSYVRQGHYWLRQGGQPVEEQLHYIITPFVQRNMNNLIRASSTRRYPVLIQGPTSSGKTSMIEYLAKRSGNKFVRINNHEHTDLQEYLGSYVSGADGKLTFQEGILVRALREGHWIVLDELNLAPTDVLEALNRLLDDNRELLIPETQEVVRPHEDFMLFATQNPAGLYGGRKALSRAFRNRFLELHFDDIPVEELTEILHRRTMIPESWCKRIVSVYQELSILRQENRIFEQKSFATLRDLFRWAQRKADTIQDLASNGYMLLAERVRKEEERIAVKKIIETVMSKKGPKVEIQEEIMFSEDDSPEIKLCKEMTGADATVVWTKAMRRLFVLVAHAIRNNEPVLLVGETGCGKTTVCQMLADAFQKQLHILNAHQNTETGDLIGAQRPIRNRAAVEDLLYRQLQEALGPHHQLQEVAPGLSELLGIYDRFLAERPDALDLISLSHREEIQANRIKAAALFEWADGSLVHAMKTGQYFLLDEISLADDSDLWTPLVIATQGFQFLATMNPGGDYGKKELSPALRNRFTEIWVPALSDDEDITQIVQSKLKPSAVQYAGELVSFSKWFNNKYDTSAAASISIRDTLAWVTFVNNSPSDEPVFAIVHGAAMVFIDTLGANPAGLLAISAASIDEERMLLDEDVTPIYFGSTTVASNPKSLQLGPFSIPKFSSTTAEDVSFSLEAPTTQLNATRVVRALQLSKPILLEGNPGVGKTTLVTALARAIGKPLTRLNLSEQTDLMDLFGSDVPVEGGQAGTFAWCDAPFLKAMKNGDWVLLDEMNLASQSVLEGLNAVLDHRGEVYISELDQTFHKHHDFRVFAAQNPHHQGGGRKGLPASFVNRFTVVYADIFRPEDLSLICRKVFPGIAEEEVKKMITFVAQLDEQVVSRRAFGHLGAPWEFNLRDTLRWLQLLTSPQFSGTARDFLDTVFAQRFRSETDRVHLFKLFESIYGQHDPRITLHHNLSSSTLQVGMGLLPRHHAVTRPDPTSTFRIRQLAPMEALVVSVRQNWPVILVGPPGSGKTSMLNQVASFAGASMVTFSMNADIDAMDLVGGYEQVDPSRELQHFMSTLDEFVRRALSSAANPTPVATRLLELLTNYSLADTREILVLLQGLAQENPASTEAIQLSQELEVLINTPQQIDGARFQWVDGILIQALQQGKWLVLDNANLCSSAVLDRLNSLLEPNGYLSINEHSTADGEARVVKPHPDFRIFMTVDPRFGELSRAMRNRAVEICLLVEEGANQGEEAEAAVEYPLDSRMYRFRQLCKVASIQATQPQLESLSTVDTSLLLSFEKQVSKGLLTYHGQCATTLNGIQAGSDNTMEHLHHQLQFFTSVADPQARSLQHLLGDNHGIDSTHALQPYHPLNNELILRRSKVSELLSKRFASVFDVLLECYNMQKALADLPSMKFERRKELQKLPAFLYAFWQGISSCIQALGHAGDSMSLIEIEGLTPKLLRQLFWAFHKLMTGSNFDRATFQTYLKMLSDVLIRLMNAPVPIAVDLGNKLSKEVSKFGSDVQLSSGLGMERIWRHFKPNTSKTQAQLAALLALETLADRLDATMWKSHLKLDEMIQIRERFASSLELVRTQDVDAGELVTALEIAVRELEGSVGEDDVTVTPYFEDVFEGLNQYLDIAQSPIPTSDRRYIAPTADVPVVRAKSSLLARRPTKLAKLADEPMEQVGAWGNMDRLARYIGLHKQASQLVAIEGRVHTAMLSRLRGADDVQLAQLERFEAEIQVLAQELVLDSEHFTNHQHDALSWIYRQILNGLYSSHCVDIIAQVDQNSLEFHPTAPISKDYRRALAPLKQCFHHASAFNKMDSQAWILLALTGLNLYVPNYPHDPALRPMIERNLFDEERTGLLCALQMLREFQIDVTGQESSFRIRQTESAIREMGEEPPVPAIVRPQVSQLDALQGEFSNLLSVIQPLSAGALSVREAALDNTLKQNISHIIRRLTEGYRSYDDITSPAVGFLVCLSIGLSLGAIEQEEESDVSRSFAYITRYTPFFGFHAYHTRNINSEILIHQCEVELARSHHAVDLRWHALHCLAIIKAVDAQYLSAERPRHLIHNLFSSLYGEWKAQLLKDQQDEAKNSSLYTYRGEEEDDDEEDRSLFPDYEDEGTMQTTQSSTSREHAIRLANMHASIFLNSDSASDGIKALLEWCAREMSRVAEGKAHGSQYEFALPAIYIALEKKADTLASSGQNKAYNFYFDANLPEAKRMMALIHRIQIRYRQIRSIWPEHATLSEVLRTCDEALEFRHVDPIAKLITKLEKLHGYMYEWQRVASKEFSTAPLFDDLTSLLVSWRQLELTTWARLFDMETAKCRDSANSWFFVAYETIIAAADSVEDAPTMKIFTKDLLKTLEGFFYATTLGQYEQRIKLLQQLHAHVVMRVQDNGLFETLGTALENFITYFSRLQKPVREALAQGRQKLEKQVVDVIKLASWKDTNIEALKQSAKTSHRKLSRSVRKFRAILNQPVSGIVNAGFPEEQIPITAIVVGEVGTTVSPTAVALCEKNVQGWSSRPTRFKNLVVTVPMMRRMTIPNTETIDGAIYIDSFIVDLESSIVELQKATPTTLTEETKVTVQHLKTRKRKVYADTMKELRQMGVKANLSTELLARQDELSTVLSALPLVGAGQGSGAEFFLHKALSMMEQVRGMAKEHHGDLTSNDIMRSIGYLEGLLHASIRQRSLLSKATNTLTRLQVPISKIVQLSAMHEQNVVRVTTAQVAAGATVRPSISWLCAILDTGAEVIAAQTKLGKIAEIDELRIDMRKWSGQLRDSADEFDHLPTLPSNVWSEAHSHLEQSIQNQLEDFGKVFNTWMERFPVSRIVLKHVESFLFSYPNATSVMASEQRVTVESHSKEILAAIDLILGSMQDVESALKGLPTSTDDAAWLVKEEEALSVAINALHAPQIGEAITTLLEKVHLTSGDDNLRVIAALFSTVQPLLDQYLVSYVSLVDRFSTLHTSTSKLLHRLAKSFIQVGTQGFCRPPEKSSDQDDKSKDEKLEEGTGLGAGEGAEDISKDIEDDEDLEELAQEKGEREGSIEDQEDAVDMGDQEMEGETGETAEKEDKGDEEGEEGDDDVQSEVGSVDDLGPSAVDEKMWDEGGKEEDLKEKEGKEDVGTENQDEQVAADQQQKDGKDEKKDEKEDKEGGEEDEEMEMEGEDQEENVGVGETEQMDPHAKEEETLDLPDELNMDGNEDDEKGDDNNDDIDMDDDLPEEEMEGEAGAQPDTVDEEIGPEQEGEEEKETTGHVEDEEMKEEEEQEQEGEEPEDDAVPLPDDHVVEDMLNDTKDERQADPDAEAGAGADANEEAHKNQQEQTSASAANRDEGAEGESAEQQQETTAEDGTLGQSAQPDAGGRGEQPEESPETQSFKKLGDVLERWYNQQKQISDARQKDETQVQQIDKEVDMANADFEHLQDEEEQADTQALGTATEEQAKALDHDMAMAVDEEEKGAARPEDNEEVQDTQQDVDMQDNEPAQQEEQEAQQQSTTDGRPQAFIGEQKPFTEGDDDASMDDAMPIEDDISDSSSVDEVETKLDLVHLDDLSALTPESARALWLSHEASTHSLSQQLTESLRLILAPTLATKLRGDFRTGKRLNLKRIIPYIASSYKRDKIWLRRSLPSKRSYQVMIALDDSKSMAESGSSNLALKTLTLVARSMAMLEVGEVAVTGFGDNINVAHDFDKPFTSEAGVKVFEQFGFNQQKTDVRGLVHKSLDLFAEARRKGSSSAGEDLWQLMLIVSDGICDSHAEIQRLVRRAQEERVMIVFVIIDSSASSPVNQSETAAAEAEKVQKGIMDLQSVEISPEGKVVRWKYMERFPFRYFLVVRDVRELPGVLAGALRQWFGEVVGSV